MTAPRMTQAERDRVAAADGILRGYRWRQRRLAELEEEISEITYWMTGVHGVSIDPDRIPGTPGSGTSREARLLAMIERRDDLEAEADALRRHLAAIDAYLKSYDSETESILRDYYLSDKSYDFICRQHYMSRETIRRRVIAVLRNFPVMTA